MNEGAHGPQSGSPHDVVVKEAGAGVPLGFDRVGQESQGVRHKHGQDRGQLQGASKWEQGTLRQPPKAKQAQKERQGQGSDAQALASEEIPCVGAYAAQQVVISFAGPIQGRVLDDANVQVARDHGGEDAQCEDQ